MSLMLAISGTLHPLVPPSVQFTAIDLGGTLQVGTAFTGSVTAANQGGATGTITYGATGLPAGLSINTATGAITGTPTTSGAFSASITAANGTQSATPYAWGGTVAVNPTFTLTGTLPGATTGAAYDAHMTLGGTFVAPVTIDASAGSLPTWMTFTVSGTDVHVTGTAPAAAETDTFTVRATDSSATPQVATASQSVAVSAASAGPTIVQQAVNQQSTGTAATLTLGAAPTAGNLLVALVMSASYTVQTPAAGWTLVASSGGTSAAGYWVGLLTRTAASGDGTTVTPVTSAVRSGLAVWEVSSATAVELGAGGKLTSGTGSLAAVGAAAPSAASVPLSATMVNGVSPNSVFGWPAGWTGIGPLTVTGFPNYGVGAGYAAVTSGAVTGPTLTWTGTRGNGVVCVGGMAYVR